MRLEWTAAALKDRHRIFDYTEEFNPAAAIQVDQRISDCVARLEQHPLSGRIGRVEGTYEVVIVDTSFIAAYVIRGQVVTVLRILHCARNWPETLSD